jgi:ketol-acid reductoisomerase
MTRVYYDDDASINILEDKVISIIGYGNQGRAQALNMRDTGIKNIIIGGRKDESRDRALQDGFEVYPIEEASRRADILFLLIPDEIAPDLYKKQIEPYLQKGNVLNFSSGYNITFQFITPPEDVDVIMVAPRMIGKGVRELYQTGDGFPSFVAVHQDASGNAWRIALALAKAIGSTKKGCIEVTFNDETYLDLMSEQATWPLIYAVFTEAFKYQVEMGHPEEAVLMEMYLSKEPAVMMEKAADVGFFKQMPFHSNTSQYGQLTGFKKTDKRVIKEFIATQYERITSGRFARQWKDEQDNGLQQFEKMRDSALHHEMSQAEKRVKSKLE